MRFQYTLLAVLSVPGAVGMDAPFPPGIDQVMIYVSVIC